MSEIIGDQNPNTLIGDDGGDIIKGSGGNDELFGQGGSDTLDGGNGGDVLNGGEGIDFADYFFSDSVVVNLATNSGAGGQAFGDSYVSIEGVLGSGRQDLLIGNDENNAFVGRGGNDVIQGAGGDDRLFGGDGDDAMSGDAGDDFLSGDLGADQLDGGTGFDIVSYASSPFPVIASLEAHKGSSGDAEGDTFTSIEGLFGSLGNDVLIGDAGNNVLNGGEKGFDRLSGGGGNDRLDGSGVLSGGGGNDTLQARYDDFASTLLGNTGKDFLGGGQLDDTLSGGAGNDTVAGSHGADRLSGGDGADVFWYTFDDDSRPGASTQDRILDFSHAEHDVIDVSLEYDDINTLENDPMHFLGKSAFTGNDGELRFTVNAGQNVTFVQADFDGDKLADLQIRLNGAINFVAGDFFL